MSNKPRPGRGDIAHDVIHLRITDADAAKLRAMAEVLHTTPGMVLAMLLKPENSKSFKIACDVKRTLQRPEAQNVLRTV